MKNQAVNRQFPQALLALLTLSGVFQGSTISYTGFAP
jgi:hypothetical protein